MRPPGFVWAGALLVACAAGASCSTSAPSTPAPTTPAPNRASVSIASMSVTAAHPGEGGYGYRVVLHLKESGGMAATIKAVDLTFMNGANVVTSSHFDSPIPATNNVMPANAVADTRELITTDTAASHPYAASVSARVTYTDVSALESSVNGSAEVPAPNEPPAPPPTSSPSTYTLRGVITEQGTDRGLEGARVETLNGANAGKATLTDAAGAYTLSGLTGETFRIRASMAGFDSGEQNVTVPDTTRADLALRPTPPATSACAYTVTPSGAVNVSFAADQFGFTVTRTSGSCSWQASSDVSWISLSGTSGSGDASLTVSRQPNALFVQRSGVITVSWTGGSAQLTVRQSGEPGFCRGVSFAVGGQTSISVPTSGGSYGADVTPEAGTPPGACAMWNATASAGITLGGTIGPTPGQVPFTVQPNGTGSPRTLTVTINISGRGTFAVTVNQN
jgi:hypothetical protein